MQLVPVPASVLRVLSPARYSLTAAVAPAVHAATVSAPIAVAAAVSAYEWLRIAACVLVFVIVRRLAWEYSDRGAPWILAAPLMTAGTLEAALGLTQFYSGALSGSGAHGTYASYDHFAGLLEMTLPFPFLFAIATLRGESSRRGDLSIRTAALTIFCFAAGAVILLGAIHSLSRMGFVCSLIALGAVAVYAVPRKRWLLALPMAAVLVIIYVSPDQLIARFGVLSTADAISGDTRLHLARETLAMIPGYWRTGTGLGGFESAFMPYKRNEPLLTSNYVHNDYLQYLVELGAPAYCVAVFLMAAILATTVHGAFHHESEQGRALAAASLASMLALLVHSLADFNSYIAANAFVFAWVGSLGVTACYSSRPPADAGSVIVDLHPSTDVPLQSCTCQARAVRLQKNRPRRPFLSLSKRI